MAERVFVLPDLGEGLDEAVVNEWLVAEGDVVELNQPIAEIETTKAVVEMPSPFAGRIVHLHAAAGAPVAVGSPLVTFEVTGASDDAGDGPVAATPAVRALAKRLGVDLTGVPPTGPGGRVTADDVERAVPAPTGGAGREVVPVTIVRRAIAENLERVAAIPQVTTFRQVDCTALEEVRGELGVSPLPVFVRALGEVAAAHPWINSSWAGAEILLHRDVNVAVAMDTERGLVVPVVRDVRSLGIAAITSRIAGLAEAARTGALSPDDTAGATIAVTNTGSYGSESGTPLLNPGHAVTIALGVIQPRALVVGGRVEARPACTLSLTFDHRVLDGATVGRALGTLVELLQSRQLLRTLPR
ncbi:MAG TPA: dihydrolipoamide acetyltransferase family protein [Actinomycetota bacterium]|nr:dihydrolipoamide acetyltransferase family protein [Actinomycetota bacterium]